jgi:short-subunit dehydrogenase
MIHTKHERWAMITGASSGIGKSFAEVLGGHGFGLILVARRQERLEQVAKALESKHGVHSVIITEDLSDDAAPERIFARTEAEGIKVDALVNNAGYGVPNHYHHSDWGTHLESIQVMVTSVCHLTHLYLPGMIERDYGRIVNVASLAAHLPGSAGHSLYAAQKSFLVKFSESLWAENKDNNVNTSALCPGFTYSEFHDVTGVRDEVSTLPKFMWMEAERVAEKGWDGVCDNKPIVITGAPNKVFAAMSRHLPNGVARGLMNNIGSKARRQDGPK